MNIQKLGKIDILCRICLTRSDNMLYFHNTKYSSFDEKEVTIREMLSTLLQIEIIQNANLPQKICAICVSLLKIGYDFKKQYELSQNTLKQLLKNHCRTLQDKEEETQVYEQETGDDETQIQVTDTLKNKTPAPVEVIIKGNKYNLNDLIIVESEEEDQNDFSGFLKNLGREVSAKYTNKNDYQFRLPVYEEEISIVTQSGKDAPGIFITSNENMVSHVGDAKKLASKPVNKRVKMSKMSQLEDDTPDQELPLLLYQCEVCQRTFSKKKNLIIHKSTVHTRKNKIFSGIECKICGLVCVTRSAYANHKLKHKGKQHHCAICGKSYFTFSHLKSHMNTHSQEQKYLCNVCGKEFLYPNGLKYHLRLHSGEKNYLCRFCGRTFTMDGALNRHLRVHTGLKPYKCSHCDRGFASHSEVKNHEWRQHTGYRPFRCDYCNKGFITVFNLKMHLLSHSGPHVCEICSKSFIDMNLLKTHMKTKHKFEYENTNSDY